MFSSGSVVTKSDVESAGNQALGADARGPTGASVPRGLLAVVGVSDLVSSYLWIQDRIEAGVIATCDGQGVLSSIVGTDCLPRSSR